VGRIGNQKLLILILPPSELPNPNPRFARPARDSAKFLRGSGVFCESSPLYRHA
jgi:hypothetical protein